jgi:hypothetical protein
MLKTICPVSPTNSPCLSPLDRPIEDPADHQVPPAIGVGMQRRELLLDQVAEGIAEVTD